MDKQTEYNILAAREAMIEVVANNPDLKSKILRFAKLIESVLSDLEMENFQLECTLSNQRRSERIVIGMLEVYGVDISTALGRSDRAINMDYSDYKENGRIRIPEKLKDFIDWDKLDKHNNEKLIQDIHKDTGISLDVIKEVFTQKTLEHV